MTESMDKALRKKFEDAVWIGAKLFDRCVVTGSSANMSFLHDGKLYITGSGTCFGRLSTEAFSVVDLDTKKVLNQVKPSKELPLHRTYYRKDSGVQAVIHVHSFYAVLWSCLPHENEEDCIPEYTPYLRMKLGVVGLVPYAKPGSTELFRLFEERFSKSDGFILGNHGPVVGGRSLMDAFYILEELEESAKIAWHLENYSAMLGKAQDGEGKLPLLIGER